MKVDVTYSIDINGKEIVLTEEEARELYLELKTKFKDSNPIPYINPMEPIGPKKWDWEIISTTLETNING